VTEIEKKLVKEEEEKVYGSRMVFMEFQSLRGFQEEEAIREVLKRFVSSNNSTVIFV